MDTVLPLQLLALVNVVGGDITEAPPLIVVRVTHDKSSDQAWTGRCVKSFFVRRAGMMLQIASLRRQIHKGQPSRMFATCGPDEHTSKLTMISSGQWFLCVSSQVRASPW
jgi:hypothetical protein